MTYKRVGIDIDNTITHLMSPTIEIMANYYEKPLPEFEQISDYNLSSVFGVTEEESFDFWNEKEHEIVKKSILNESTLKLIFDTYVSKDTEVYFITNRDHDRYYKDTFRWLVDNKVPFTKLIHTSGKSKVDLLKNLNIEVMVDDKPELFEEVALRKQLGKLKTRMVCVDYPFNQHSVCDDRISVSGEFIEEGSLYVGA